LARAQRLEVADFSLAIWRSALVNSQGDTRDGDEAAWASETLAAICDEDLFLRWILVGDVVTGSDVGEMAMSMEGGGQ
jgi:hypothetical protein